jgi:hypothetical protein
LWEAVLHPDEKSELSTPDVYERHFSTLNADDKQQATSLLKWQIYKKQVFTRVVNRHKATSLLPWQIDKKATSLLEWQIDKKQ